jgi:hypothetical protein
VRCSDLHIIIAPSRAQIWESRAKCARPPRSGAVPCEPINPRARSPWRRVLNKDNFWTDPDDGDGFHYESPLNFPRAARVCLFELPDPAIDSNKELLAPSPSSSKCLSSSAATYLPRLSRTKFLGSCYHVPICFLNLYLQMRR